MIVTHIQQGAILSGLGFHAFFSRGTPNPSEVASIFKEVCRLGLNIFRYGVVVTSNFSFPIASSWGFSSLNSTFFFSRVPRGEVTSAGISLNWYAVCDHA